MEVHRRLGTGDDMTEITLFAAPGSCSRVTAIVLEEMGLPFRYELVRFLAGFHRSPAYRAVNPKGKVPALIVDGEALTENVAIITWLDRAFPDAGVMPPVFTAMSGARNLADLCFCSATLHPLVTRVCMPGKIGGEAGAAAVKAVGTTAMDENLALIEHRLTEGPWWYGERWSAMDAYLFWVFGRLSGAGYDLTPWVTFRDHASRMEARPAVQRALGRDAEAEALLAAERSQVKASTAA